MNVVDVFLNPEVLWVSLPLLLRGLVNTLLLGVVSIAFGLPLGLVVSLVRLYAPRLVGALAVGYIDLFRALPPLVVLIVIYYALPFVGVRLNSWTSAVLAFSLVLSAFSAEIFRSGIESISRGQFEAAGALGLPLVLTLRKVVMPQAIRVVVPPITSSCVSMFKETSLASAVALPELLKEATDAQAYYANPTPLIGAAAVYFIVLWPLVRCVNLLERRFKAERAR